MTVLQFHGSISVSPVVLELSFINVTIVPCELASSLHLTFNKWPIIGSCFSLHQPCNFVISLELSFVVALVFLEDTITVHVTILELTFILSAIVPFHFALSVLETVPELTFVFSDTWEMLLALSVGFSGFPFSFISHFVELVEEFPLSLENSILELSFIVRSVWVDMESFTIGFSINELALQIGAV